MRGAGETTARLITDAQPEPVDFTFPDDEEISSWAKEAVYNCYDYSLISGDERSYFNPHGQHHPLRGRHRVHQVRAPAGAAAGPRRSSPRTRTRRHPPSRMTAPPARSPPSPPLPPRTALPARGNPLPLRRTALSARGTPLLPRTAVPPAPGAVPPATPPRRAAVLPRRPPTPAPTRIAKPTRLLDRELTPRGDENSMRKGSCG